MRATRLGASSRIVLVSRTTGTRELGPEPPEMSGYEPTGNLDSASGGAILALLEDLHADGATIVVITHNQQLASRLRGGSRCSTARSSPTSVLGHLDEHRHAGPPAAATGRPLAGRERR